MCIVGLDPSLSALRLDGSVPVNNHRLKRHSFFTVSVYGPTTCSSPEAKYEFYHDLSRSIHSMLVIPMISLAILYRQNSKSEACFLSQLIASATMFASSKFVLTTVSFWLTPIFAIKGDIGSPLIHNDELRLTISPLVTGAVDQSKIVSYSGSHPWILVTPCFTLVSVCS